jgi:hypothetical protein
VPHGKTRASINRKLKRLGGEGDGVDAGVEFVEYIHAKDASYIFDDVGWDALDLVTMQCTRIYREWLAESGRAKTAKRKRTKTKSQIAHEQALNVDEWDEEKGKLEKAVGW